MKRESDENFYLEMIVLISYWSIDLQKFMFYPINCVQDKSLLMGKLEINYSMKFCS